jgi:hypothetical protein
MLAASFGHLEVVRFLLDAGADPWAADRLGEWRGAACCRALPTKPLLIIHGST